MFFFTFCMLAATQPSDGSAARLWQEVAHQAERLSGHSSVIPPMSWCHYGNQTDRIIRDYSGILCQICGTLPVSKPWCVDVCCQVVFGVWFCVAEKGQSLKTEVIFVPIVWRCLKARKTHWTIQFSAHFDFLSITAITDHCTMTLGRLVSSRQTAFFGHFFLTGWDFHFRCGHPLRV